MTFNNKYKKMFFLLITIGYIGGLRSECDAITGQKLKDWKTKKTLYYELFKLGVSAFSSEKKDKKSLEDAMLPWSRAVSCAHDMITKMISAREPVPAIYKSFMQQIEDANRFVQFQMKSLYGGAYRDKTVLGYVITELNKHLKNMETVYAFSLRTIMNTIKVPALPSKVQELNTIFNNYKTFFASYNDLKKKQQNLTPDQIMYFLQVSNVITLPKGLQVTGRQYQEKKLEAIARFYDQLNSFINQAKINIESLKKSWFGSNITALEGMLKQAEEIKSALLVANPTLLPPSILNELPLSNDSASLILLSESGILTTALNTIKDFINTIK